MNYSYLGVGGGDVFLTLIKAFGLPNDIQGVVVGGASPGGPAGRAGVQSAVDTDDDGIPEQVDIIQVINDESISNMSELIGYLASETGPGTLAKSWSLK